MLPIPFVVIIVVKNILPCTAQTSRQRRISICCIVAWVAPVVKSFFNLSGKEFYSLSKKEICTFEMVLASCKRGFALYIIPIVLL